MKRIYSKCRGEDENDRNRSRIILQIITARAKVHIRDSNMLSDR